MNRSTIKRILACIALLCADNWESIGIARAPAKKPENRWAGGPAGTEYGDAWVIGRWSAPSSSSSRVAKFIGFSPDSKRLCVLPGTLSFSAFDRFNTRESIYILGSSGTAISKHSLRAEGRAAATAISWDHDLLAVSHHDERDGSRAGPRGSIGLYSLSDGGRTHRIDLGEDAASSLDIASGGGLLAYCGRHAAVVRSLITNRSVVLTQATRDMPCVAFSSDARFVAVARGDGSLGLFEVASGRCAVDCERATGNLHPVRFSPDGRFVAAVCEADRSVLVWNLSTGRVHRRFGETEDWYPYDVAFVPPGDVVASSGAYTNRERWIRFWNVSSGEPVGRVRAESEQPLAFSPDGRFMASSGNAETVVVWRIANTENRREPDRAVVPFTNPEFDAEWERLRSQDCRAAYATIQRLIAAGESSSRRLAPLVHPQVVEGNRLQKLFADLDADQFIARRRAKSELAALMPAIAAQVQEALSTAESAEVRQSLKSLEEDYDGIRVRAPNVLRTLRAIYVLERVGGKEATQALERLATGHPRLPVTEQAAFALERLSDNSEAFPNRHRTK